MAGDCPLRVMEFYAGIGGFHYAMRECGISGTIIASIDINTNTTSVYSRNFPHTPQLNRNICGLTAEELDKFEADVFFLSPPCQPFTRQGHRRDNLDRRTDSFFHLMHIISEMHNPPSYLLMENVKGFETSQTRDHFVGMLRTLKYNVQEFLLSPNQFGIPNSRLRFYLLAKREPLKFALSFGSREMEGEGGLSSDPSRDSERLIGFTSQHDQSVSDKIRDVSLGSSGDREKRISELGIRKEVEGRSYPVKTSVSSSSSSHTCEVLGEEYPSPTKMGVTPLPPSPPSPPHTCEEMGTTIAGATPLPSSPPPSPPHTCGEIGITNTLPPSPPHTCGEIGITNTLPPSPPHTCGKMEKEFPSLTKMGATSPHTCEPISKYLEDLSSSDLQRFLLPDRVLQKYSAAMDIVQRDSRHSCCFTNAYGKYAVGTGSVLQHSLEEESLEKMFKEFKNLQDKDDFVASVECLRPLHLRYFTPREVANLMCFPEEGFGFPCQLTNKQCYKALGNSLNIRVVAVLMKYLFS